MPETRERPDVAASNLIRVRSGLERKTIDHIQNEIRALYAADARPWVLGYSGGKDSTTCLQLIWHALAKLPPEERTKPIYVIASDTLVETPVIVDFLDTTLAQITSASLAAGMPFKAEKVRPRLEHTFWVNMIGRGYPAPYRRFRWCTDRLKIEPANKFIEERVDEHGEVILILGVRKAESATRAQVMALHKKPGEQLSRHTVLRNAWVYTPIEDFSVDDVWSYLLAVPCPWGGTNRDLVTMYRNAGAGECPLVVDKTTPSCGGGRFGCWTCTVVERDKSMEATIDSGEDWMQALLDLRNWLAATREPSKKHQFREVRRRDGRVHTWGDQQNKIIWGPYKMDVRRDILRRLLDAQVFVRKHGRDQKLSLITDEELHEIRRLWRTEEGDWEDSVPRIHREVTGEEREWIDDDNAGAPALDRDVLATVCQEHELPPGLVRELVDLERDLQGLGRRTLVYDKLGRILAKDWRSADQVFSDIGWQADGTEDEEAADAS